MIRRREGIYRDRRFLPLKLVDGSDAGTWEQLLDLLHLCIVWRDDEHVFEGQLTGLSVTVRPGRVALKDSFDQLSNPDQRSPATRQLSKDISLLRWRRSVD